MGAESTKSIFSLASRLATAGQTELALQFYLLIVELPTPTDAERRTRWLRSANNAINAAHKLRDTEVGLRIFAKVEAFATENPYIYHNAACIFALVKNRAKVVECFRLARDHEYEQLAKMRTDSDLADYLSLAEVKALFS